MIKCSFSLWVVCCIVFNSYGQVACTVNDNTDVINVQITVSGTTVTGEARVWYKCFPTNDPDLYNLDNQITKPFVICEGIDIAGDQDPEFVYSQVGSSRLVNLLRRRGYDVIILDLRNNTVEIEKNAMLFRQLILEIQQQLDANESWHKITVGGVSMGGLITRYALAFMESQGEVHRVDKFITFDTPHRGANIPLGYQHFVDMWLNPFVSLQQASATLDILNINPLKFMDDNFLQQNGTFFMETAALEMSAVSHNQNIWRLNLINELNTVGNYPQRCRKIAISSGASGVNRDFNAGDRLLEWMPGICLVDQTIELPFGLGDLDLRWCPFAWEQQFNAMPGDWLNRVYQSDLGFQLEIGGNNIDWSNRQRFSFDRDYLVAPANPDIDHVPGGYFELDPLRNVANTLNTLETTVPINWSLQYCVTVPGVGTVCQTVGIDFSITIPWHAVIGRMESDFNFEFTFIPTLSALDVAGDDWFRDVRQIPRFPFPRDRNITPFDAIFPSAQNEFHTDFSHDAQQFTLDELATRELFIQNTTIQSGESNRFEAFRIIIDDDSDPVPNRSDVGEVIIESGTNVEFAVPENGEIILGNGLQMQAGANIVFNTANPFEFNSQLGFLRMASSSDNGNKNTSPIQYSKVSTPKYPVNYRSYIPGMTNKDFSNTLTSNEKKFDALVYPNPASEKFSIALNVFNPETLNISVYNIMGNKIYELPTIFIATPGFYKYDIESLNFGAGLYTVKITGKNYFETKKVQVVK